MYAAGSVVLQQARPIKIQLLIDRNETSKPFVLSSELLSSTQLV